MITEAKKMENGMFEVLKNGFHIMANFGGGIGLKGNGIYVDNYKATTLREVAKKYGVTSMSVSVDNYNKYGSATVYFKNGEYSIWQDGEQLFYAESSL